MSPASALFRLILSCLIASSVLLAGAAAASDASIDVTFAAASTNPGPGWRRAYVVGGGTTNEVAVAGRRAPDGGYVLAGYTADGIVGVKIFLAKYLPNGDYDTGFGGTAATGNAGSGRVLKDAYLTSVTDMTIDAQGRIIVVGGTPGALGQSDFGVVRFNTDGSDDTSFAGDGGTAVAFDYDAAHNRVADVPGRVLALADGSVFVAGKADDDIGGVQTTIVSVVKLKPDGSRDTTWSNSGNGTDIYCLASCAGVLTVKGLAYDAAMNRLAIGGDYAAPAGASDWFLITRELSAAVSQTFVYAVNLGGGQTAAGLRDLIVQPDGKLVAVGYVLDANGLAHGAVLRRNAVGVGEDTTFGNTGGRGLYVDPMTDTSYRGVARDSAGRLTVAGSLLGNASHNAGMVKRLLPGGTIDTSFNGTGNASFYGAKCCGGAATSSSTDFTALFLDAGRPVLLGYAPDMASDFTDQDLIVARLQTDLIFANGLQAGP